MSHLGRQAVRAESVASPLGPGSPRSVVLRSAMADGAKAELVLATKVRGSSDAGAALLAVRVFRQVPEVASLGQALTLGSAALRRGKGLGSAARAERRDAGRTEV